MFLLLSLDADIFYSFVVNGEVTFPCACMNVVCTQLGTLISLFLLEALYCHSFTVQCFIYQVSHRGQHLLRLKCI